ncbi:MAG: hypothetical protein R3E95_10935 [Thiolinea sp.]
MAAAACEYGDTLDPQQPCSRTRLLRLGNDLQLLRNLVAQFADMGDDPDQSPAITQFSQGADRQFQRLFIQITNSHQ